MGVIDSSQAGGDADISHDSFSGGISGVSSPMIPEVTGIVEEDGIAMDDVATVIIAVCSTG